MSEHEFELYLKLLSRCLSLTTAQREQIADELRDHLQERLDELASQGVPREKAVFQALDEFGDAAVLAAHFTTIAHLRRRKFLMRLSLGSAVALTAGILIALAFWPENRALHGPALAIAQEKPKTPGQPPKRPVTVVPAPVGLLSSDENRDRSGEKIQQMLDDVVDFSVETQPLKDSLDFISKRFNVPIVIDRKALEEANIEPTIEVHSDVQGIKLKNVLKLMLEQIPQPLAYMVEDEVLKITTREKSRDRSIEVVVYDCRDLVHVQSIRIGETVQHSRIQNDLQVSPPEERSAPLQSKSAEVSRDHQPAPGPASQTQQAKAAGNRSKSVAKRGRASGAISSNAAIPLIRAIENATEPDKWADNGGEPGTITEFGGLLIVRQTRDIHDEIKRVLADIRQMIKDGAFAALEKDTAAQAATAAGAPGQ